MQEKMMSDPFQAWFGVKLSVLLAAVLGGAVAAILIGGSLVRQIFNTLIGAVAAVYIVPALLAYAGKYIAIEQEIEHAAIFIGGLIGMIFCEAIIRVAQRARNRADEIADSGIDTIIK